ncbi:MAG: peptide chain release factor N(5)-glutamine methyltransferase [Alphaproteobacteria bacterium]|nr:peptide chain release factor N(5)-glutamine methyltransferase [Alphaproteobacteria bacterium]
MSVAVKDQLLDATRRLAAAGIANARHEARLLQALAGSDAARFAAFVGRRTAHEPYARIRGAREFWSLDFTLSADTLDPRPDSETLIEAAFAALPDRGAALRAIDFGTGTGALLLALLSEYPAATGIGIDILAGAVTTARQNAAALGLAARASFIAGDWAETKLVPADIVLANPPYISGDEMTALPPEVRCFDPHRALDGGRDGLEAYRSLAPVLNGALRPAGWAFVELGFGQAEAVTQIMAAAGLRAIETRRDLAGCERCLILRQGNLPAGKADRAKKQVGFGGHPV